MYFISQFHKHQFEDTVHTCQKTGWASAREVKEDFTKFARHGLASQYQRTKAPAISLPNQKLSHEGNVSNHETPQTRDSAIPIHILTLSKKDKQNPTKAQKDCRNHAPDGGQQSLFET